MRGTFAGRSGVGIWTRGGDAWERYRAIGPVVFYRRIEDQRWSPNYTERRIEYGIAIRGIDRRISIVRSMDLFIGQRGK